MAASTLRRREHHGAAAAASTCAICLEDGVGDTLQRALMPCCTRTDSTIAYCVPCMRTIVARAPGGRVGQCPTCRQHVSVDAEGVVHKAERRDTCAMCRQQRLIVDELCCSACLLGRRLGPMRYECDRCHRVQHIAHPMYLPSPPLPLLSLCARACVCFSCHSACIHSTRPADSSRSRFRYQPDPLSFGTDTWACHAGCAAFTHWRISPVDANRIPPEECPERSLSVSC